ncbi:MAG: ATP-dependent helicase HrpB, partial [Hyphomicrobiaceae bacterium]|nr:ATP-dependent helicase HrpB [Hyphomicrobiaceae bacterium]
SVSVIESAGRMYPVDTRYAGRDMNRRIEDEMAAVITRALSAEDGSILAFLPGQGEIRRLEERLLDAITDATVDIAPLYGAMDPAAQDRAVEPAKPGRRKVVLATSIAETSLTIEGVRVVVDCGLARVPRYDAESGVTRLQTVRVSRASADQRRGRAGRTEPGVCYRLWDEPQNLALLPFAEPEIRTAGLASLVLDCAEWGTSDPLTLRWLDPPPAAALTAARAELSALRALDGDGRITDLGRRIRALPLPPRLAAMVIAAGAIGAELDAAEIAALVVERGLGGSDPDLSTRLVNFRRDRSKRADDARGLARRWAAMARAESGAAEAKTGGAKTEGAKTGDRPDTAALLALAYPDRIAKQRDGSRDGGQLGARGQYLLANGRGAYLGPAHPLSSSPWLVVAELQGSAARARILLAAPAGEATVLTIAVGRITDSDEVAFDDTALAVRARRVRRLDAIVLAAEPRRLEPGPEVANALAGGIGSLGADGAGVARLPWSKAQLQLRDRIAFLRASGFADLPDLTDAALAATAEGWLAPYLTGKSRFDEITAADLGVALDTLVPWTARQLVDAEAPTHFTAPTGNAHAIDYEGPQAPALHIRVQELFGLTRHPTIARGARPLTLHLLSPASRPIQITKDLPGFWSGSWTAVKADMKGRYPRHPWPDDPATAAPTARAKPRGT